jgi:hypothetical protein
MARPNKTVTEKPTAEQPHKPGTLIDCVSFVGDGGNVSGAVARLELTRGGQVVKLYLSQQGRASARVAFGNRSL